MYEQMGLSSNEDRIVQNSKLEATRRPLDVAAESKDLGDYFEYTLKQSVTIGKNQSALVPILQSRIDAEKVTLWTANSNQPPLRAIWIKNGSGLTLDSGTFNIIDGGTFAGEGLLQTVHPDERRLLSFAADTAVRVTSQSDFKNQPVSRIRLTRGLIENRVTPELQDAFRRVLDQKNKIAGLQTQTGMRRQELDAINRDQGRIRENMKALKGSAEEKDLVQRYTRQLNSQEDRLSALNKEIADLQGQESHEQQKLEAMVQQIAIDQKF